MFLSSPLRQFLQRSLGRYIIIGGSVYLIELLIILLLVRSHVGPTLAVGVAFWSGLALSFCLQKLVTFQDSRLHHRILVPQLAAYGLLVLFNFGFTIGMTALLAHVLPAALIRTIALGITTFWNYYLYKTSIFNQA